MDERARCQLLPVMIGIPGRGGIAPLRMGRPEGKPEASVPRPISTTRAVSPVAGAEREEEWVILPADQLPAVSRAPGFGRLM